MNSTEVIVSCQYQWAVATLLACTSSGQFEQWPCILWRNLPSMQRYVLAFMTLIVSDCMDALCKLDCNMLIAYS